MREPRTKIHKFDAPDSPMIRHIWVWITYVPLSGQRAMQVEAFEKRFGLEFIETSKKMYLGHFNMRPA